MSSVAVNRIDPKELIQLCAVDSLLYARTFFPNTFRQASPEFHKKLWNAFDNFDHRYVGVEVFRGGAKTTIARTALSKFVAYGLSRTSVFTSASQSHAIRSVRWLRRQVEGNSFWANTFGLRKGSKWTDEEIEIINEIEGCSIYILAVGITGQIRGINLEDRRPDLIIADDPCDEENSGTPEQRAKTAALFFGALAPGLAPASEAPHSKMVLLQTGLDKEDLINTAHRDPQWHTVKCGVFTADGKSAWPERWSTEELYEMKEAYTARNQLHLWLREYECTITSPEEAPLKPAWLRFYQSVPEYGLRVIAIDPAISGHKNAHKFAMVDVTFYQRDVYLNRYFLQRGVNIEEAWTKFYTWAIEARPYKVIIESVAYQKALAQYFQEKMRQFGSFWVIHPLDDRRRKQDRIIQSLAGRAFDGHIWVHPSHHEFIDAWGSWRTNQDSDVLDALAIAITGMSNTFIAANSGEEEYIPSLVDERYIKPLEVMGGCP